jgi:light-regulated signal transduction histidine kinase (bacteriophytochrome)
MRNLMDGLLALSQVGTHGRPFGPTDCEAVVDKALNDLAVAIAESGAVITRDPLPTVLGDAQQLEQLFQNLVSNAIKFHGDEEPRVHITARRKRTEWLFSVRDNGIGIDSKYSERIFVVFQRLHAREERSGTGIGLAISKKIVERHGGRIWIESRPGEGATFYFTVPRKERALAR